MSGFRTRITRASGLLSPAAGDGVACLVKIYGQHLGRKFDLETSMVVGRGEECDIVIEMDSVSRSHAIFERQGDTILVRDLGSTNGTYVNDATVTEAILNDGDLVKIGNTIFKFLSGGNVERAYHEEIYMMTIVDGLTRVHNKRYLQDFLERELARAQRYDRELSVVLFDIDHFKRVNDTHGHLSGDHVLREVADLVRGRIRREEVFARYGGEEFCAVLPETAAAGAFQFADQVRKTVEAHSFEFDGDVIPITVSAGVANATEGTKDSDALIRAADKNLYKAKELGRNRVVGSDDA